MRVGQIRRLHHWLDLAYPLNEANKGEVREQQKRFKPIIAEIVVSAATFPEGFELQHIESIEGHTLEEIERMCFGYPITHLILRGFHPGKYMGTCRTCDTTFIGDKRCLVCIPCAGVRSISLS